jgi:hypothetical protein
MGKFSTGLRIGIALAIVPMITLGASSKKQRIDSHWKDRDITIDGDNGEWPGPLVPVDEHQRLDAAAANDGQFLYLVLTTSDATLRAQIMGQGLIVWFDPGGGDKKVFGIKFPVGMASGDMPGRGRGFHRPDPSGAGSGQGDPSGRAVTLEPPNRLEVFGPEKDDAHSFVADKAPGLSVKVGQVEGALVYELKVPLVHTGELPYAIDAKNGAPIGLGFETPKRERPADREGRGMGGFGGGGGGRGGGGMGGRGGMGRGGGGMGRGGGMGPGATEPPKPLKAWTVLQLSAAR